MRLKLLWPLMALLAATAFPAHAAVSLVGTYSGNDCPIPTVSDFSNCYASQQGIFSTPGDGRSPVVYKRGSDGLGEVSTNFPTITGNEFNINLTGNTLSFNYTAGAGDPILHYYSVKQANSYALFYDPAGITSGSTNLSDYFRQPGYSHITFFDTGGVINPTDGGAVPEPATWAMMLMGFGAVGFGLRRRKDTNPRLRLRVA